MEPQITNWCKDCKALLDTYEELLEAVESILEDVDFEEDKGCYSVQARKLRKAKYIITKGETENG